MKIFFVTGASGVGKTSLISELEDKYGDNKRWSFLEFDSIGVPTSEEMIKEYGSVEKWQKEKTYEWIDRIVSEYNKDIIILEGQVNPQFIKDGFERNNFSNYEIILIDCGEEVMRERLKKRRQSELFTDDMKNWLNYLREQAKKLDVIIINTSKKDKNETLLSFEKEIGLNKKSEHTYNKEFKRS